MRATSRVRHFWSELQASLWLVPGLMAAAAIVVALLVPRLDGSLPAEWASDISWLYDRSAAGARDVLAVVAGSMITVAGLAFSILVVALQLASSQFGPRVLRNFMRDRGSQVVLGTFIATFLYCLLVMRTVAESESDVSPRLAVPVAVVLAIASLAVLIYFLHHAAASIHAPNVIASVARELHAAIDRMYPEQIGDPSPQPAAALALDSPANVPAHRSGYLQAVDSDALMQAAREHDVVVRLLLRPGEFIVEGRPLLELAPAARDDARVRRRLQHALILGDRRTPDQDVQFTIEQLVQIAVRALSSSYNDPFTAAGCLDHLEAAIDRLLSRRVPAPVRRDDAGTPRVIAEATPIASLAESALLPIVASAESNPLVVRKVQEMTARLERRAPTAEMRRVLRAQREKVTALAARAQPRANDQGSIASTSGV